MPFLIDGNNLLGSWRAQGATHAGDGREEVVRRVCDFCRRRGASATVVFDGHPLRGEREGQALGKVEIRYPGPGRDADALIRELIDGSRHPESWTVVTSDKPLYSYARTRGAGVMRAHEWNAVWRRLQGGTPSQAGRRRRAEHATRREKPERETDIEGWLRRFERR